MELTQEDAVLAYFAMFCTLRRTGN